MPIEYAIPKVHRFLMEEGIRDEVVLMASGVIRTAYDVAKAIALGARRRSHRHGELVALGCTRLGTCEKDRGCPLGITTTDPELCALIDPDEGARRIVNLFRSLAGSTEGHPQVPGPQEHRGVEGEDRFAGVPGVKGKPSQG